MTRQDDLLKIYKELDKNVLTIVEPMIGELVFIEEQLADLRTKPFIRYHPTDPTMQKQTPAGKLYKDLLAQQKDIVRILCSQLHKTGSDEGDSPLRAYLKTLEYR